MRRKSGKWDTQPSKSESNQDHTNANTKNVLVPDFQYQYQYHGRLGYGANLESWTHTTIRISAHLNHQDQNQTKIYGTYFHISQVCTTFMELTFTFPKFAQFGTFLNVSSRLNICSRRSIEGCIPPWSYGNV